MLTVVTVVICFDTQILHYPVTGSLFKGVAIFLVSSTSFLEHFLVPSPMSCPELILLFPCPIPGVSHFFKIPSFILVENSIYKPRSGCQLCCFRMGHHFQWLVSGENWEIHMCIYIHTYVYIYICEHIFLHLLLYNLFLKIIISYCYLQFQPPPSMLVTPFLTAWSFIPIILDLFAYPPPPALYCIYQSSSSVGQSSHAYEGGKKEGRGQKDRGNLTVSFNHFGIILRSQLKCNHPLQWILSTQGHTGHK